MVLKEACQLLEGISANDLDVLELLRGVHSNELRKELLKFRNPKPFELFQAARNWQHGIIVPSCWKVVAQKWRIGKTKFICRERDFHFPRSGLSSRGLWSQLDSQMEAGYSRSRKM